MYQKNNIKILTNACKKEVELNVQYSALCSASAATDITDYKQHMNLLLINACLGYWPGWKIAGKKIMPGP